MAFAFQATKSQHTAVIRHLYRRVLMNRLDWSLSREEFIGHAIRARASFEKHRHEMNPRRQEELMEETRAWLKTNQHPEPYVVPWQVGGSMHQRNDPPHPSLLEPPPEPWRIEPRDPHDRDPDDPHSLSGQL